MSGRCASHLCPGGVRLSQGTSAQVGNPLRCLPRTLGPLCPPRSTLPLPRLCPASAPLPAGHHQQPEPQPLCALQRHAGGAAGHPAHVSGGGDWWRRRCMQCAVLRIARPCVSSAASAPASLTTPPPRPPPSPHTCRLVAPRSLPGVIFSVAHPPMSGPGLQFTIPLCEWCGVAGCVMHAHGGGEGSVQGIDAV